MSDEVLTIREVAAIFGVHEHTVRDWIKTGKLPAAKIAGWRILRTEVDKLLVPKFFVPRGTGVE